MDKYKNVRVIEEVRGFPWDKWRKVKEYKVHEHVWKYSGHSERVGSVRRCKCGITQMLHGFKDAQRPWLNMKDMPQYFLISEPVWLDSE